MTAGTDRPPRNPETRCESERCGLAGFVVAKSLLGKVVKPPDVNVSFELTILARGHGVGLAARELDREAEEGATSIGLTEQVEHGVLPGSLRAGDERRPETYLLKLLWPYAMPGDVVHTVFRRQDFGDGHAVILRRHGQEAPGPANVPLTGAPTGARPC